MAEGSYKNAAKNGTWNYYDNGQLYRQVTYKNGLKTSESSKPAKK
ncbi:MAG: hypothetical protein J6X35_09575 [Bacteroidales bacterium]|nr:hypothetical protein [Bacteroidales bacterium]